MTIYDIPIRRWSGFKVSIGASWTAELDGVDNSTVPFSSTHPSEQTDDESDLASASSVFVTNDELVDGFSAFISDLSVELLDTPNNT